jgi:hypothetical protein
MGQGDQCEHTCASYRLPDALTTWVLGPCFIWGTPAPFSTANSSEPELELILLRKSTSSSAFVSGISEENKGLQSECMWREKVPMPYYYTANSGFICSVSFSIKWRSIPLLSGVVAFLTLGWAAPLSPGCVVFPSLCVGLELGEDPTQCLHNVHFHHRLSKQI